MGIVPMNRRNFLKGIAGVAVGVFSSSSLLAGDALVNSLANKSSAVKTTNELFQESSVMSFIAKESIFAGDVIVVDEDTRYIRRFTAADHNRACVADVSRSSRKKGDLINLHFNPYQTTDGIVA
jgi:hypothetical protein